MDRWRQRAKPERPAGRKARRPFKRVGAMNRAELLQVVEDLGPPYLARPLLEGSAEVYGYFGDGRWIVAVRSQHGAMRFGMVAEDESHRIRVSIVDRVPWMDWSGDDVPESPINQGDRPEQYREWKHGRKHVEG